MYNGFRGAWKGMKRIILNADVKQSKDEDVYIRTEKAEKIYAVCWKGFTSF